MSYLDPNNHTVHHFVVGSLSHVKDVVSIVSIVNHLDQAWSLIVLLADCTPREYPPASVDELRLRT